MAKTTFETDNALTRKAFEERLFRDTIKEAYWSRFMAPGENAVVMVDDRFTREQGDRITFGLAARLGGLAQAVRGEGQLEGAEQRLTTSSFNVTLEKIRVAVRDRGSLDRQRAVFSIDNISMERLRGQGSEIIDDLAFEKIYLSPTTTFFGGDATSEGDLDTTDLITPELLSRIKAAAITGRNRRQTPLRPIRIEGKSWYIMLVHPDVMHDMFEDSAFLQARREAEVRGEANPIFQGAKAIYNGVIIHEHESVEIFLDGGGGSNVPGARNLFLGQQSLVWAWGKRPQVVAEEFDYGDEHGFAWGFLAGVAKPTFDTGKGTNDYGSFQVTTARTRISDL